MPSCNPISSNAQQASSPGSSPYLILMRPKSQSLCFSLKNNQLDPSLSSCSTVPIRFFRLDSHPLHIKHTHANWTSRINRAGKIINAGSSSKPCVITGGYLYTYIYIHYTYTIIYMLYNVIYNYIYICVTY